MPVKVAIHQADFFPWLGNFNKFLQADKFVILDDVQYIKTGSNWSNRVMIISNRKAGWITIPLVRNYHGLRSYKEMKIENSFEWRKKLINSLKTNYGKAKYFDEIFPQIYELINYRTDYLFDYNMNAYKYFIRILKMNEAKIILSSSLEHYNKSTDLLIEIVKAAGGDTYICGGGASGYQEDQKFFISGINLVYQNFIHPVYPQFNTEEFIPGLSVIDTLMNCGAENTYKIISSEVANEKNNI